MLNVTVGTNTSRNTVPTPEDYTLRQCLEENGVNYSAAQTSLDGCVLQPGDLDKTLPRWASPVPVIWFLFRKWTTLWLPNSERI